MSNGVLNLDGCKTWKPKHYFADEFKWQNFLSNLKTLSFDPAEDSTRLSHTNKQFGLKINLVSLCPHLIIVCLSSAFTENHKHNAEILLFI